jgi:RNA polymerase sigma-70 factor, ECF subfamily
VPDPHQPRLEQAYRRYFPIIRAKCARMLGDAAEAEDVAQETFVRLWNSDLASADPKIVAAWIYRTSTRIAVDRLRHRAVVTRFASRPAPPAPHPDAALEANDALRALAAALDPRALSAAILHRFDGLTHPQVAEVLGLSERTVRRLITAFDEAAGPSAHPEAP